MAHAIKRQATMAEKRLLALLSNKHANKKRPSYLILSSMMSILYAVSLAKTAAFCHCQLQMHFSQNNFLGNITG
jgi:hypothetical protein